MYKYDIYICAAAPDASWAHELSSRIKKYTLPPKVVLPDDKADYKNIYTDTDEQDLTEESKALLDSCRYMLVICSPRSKNSRTILDKLLYFEQTRAKSNIIAVIVEGEPMDSFPSFFIEEKMVPHILPDGSIEERLEIIEPVASDLRGENKKHTEQLFRYETVRITATVLGMVPDALEQRHNKRRKQRAVAVAAVLSAVLLAVSIIFGYFGLKAYHEGKIADKQTQECLLVCERLMTELPQEFADDPQASEYVYETILDALYTLYETGSVNFSGIDVWRVLEISDTDSAQTILRKASLLRSFESEYAMAAYEAAAEALTFSNEDKNLFKERMALFSSGDYGFGIYAENDADDICRGDIIVSVNHKNVSGIKEWNYELSEMIGDDVSVVVLRPGPSGDVLASEEITVDRPALLSLFVLGV